MKQHVRGTVVGVNLAGMRFGRLVANSPKWRPERGRWYWSCACDCGATAEVVQCNLRGGKTVSCGCFMRQRVSETKRTHGAAGSDEWRSWCRIRTRCSTPSVHRFDRYGGRGVYVCARWREDFAAFLADMGKRPSKRHSIDRINNDGSYTCGKCEECVAKGAPSNCRWADAKTQQRNTRKNVFLTFRGEKLCIAEWCERFRLDNEMVRRRIIRGWSAEDALTTPSGGKRPEK